MIKNLRHAQSILKSIAEKSPSYGFYAIANLMEQDVYYEIGKAPDWTSDIALCMTQSIGETGLIPPEFRPRRQSRVKNTFTWNAT